MAQYAIAMEETRCSLSADCPPDASCFVYPTGEHNANLSYLRPPTEPNLKAQYDAGTFFAQDSIGEDATFTMICMCNSMIGVAGVEPYDFDPSSPNYLQANTADMNICAESLSYR
jgi:hypothetical protein